MLSIGTHKVKVIGCYTGESSEKKTPFFGIEFQKVDSDETIFWTAYMSDKVFKKKNGTDTTMIDENLQKLNDIGYIGKKFTDMSNDELTIDQLFKPVDNLSIVVEHEDYQKNDGEIGTKAVVKFINVGSQVDKFSHQQAVVKFKSYNFDSKLMGLKSKNKSEKKTVQAPTKVDHGFASDEIPF